MTPNRTNPLFKCLSLCLITALLWGATCGYEAFLGPGISDAAAAANPGVLTPTDVIPIEQPAEPLAITTKVQNIRVIATVTRADVNTGTAEITATSSNLSLVQYDTGSLSASTFSGCVTDYWNSDKLFYIGILSSHNFAANTRLVNLYLDAPTSMSNPLNSISFSKGAIFSDSGSSVPAAISFVKAVLGMLIKTERLMLPILCWLYSFPLVRFH